MHYRSGLRTLTAALIGVALARGAAIPSVRAASSLNDWMPGPASVGDSTYLGAVDSPSDGARIVAPGLIQLGGWFVDRSAQGWAGADDVEIFLGTMGNGGKPLSHAYFLQARPDVAATLGNPYWSASGWTAIVPTSVLPAGRSTLSVYVHTPSKGWWYRQVGVDLGPSATGLPVPTLIGFDVSFPQCSGPEPSEPAFAVVGVNGGRAFSPNPCLARQYAWALGSTSPSMPHVGLYMNTGNPGPDASTHWPSAGTTWPQPCDGTWSASCSFDYGWLAAQDAFAYARTVAGDDAALAPWWLDVESANSWSSDVSTNSADLQGAIAYLRSSHVGMIGIYALAADWEEIVGASSAAAAQNAPFGGLPNWRPGARSGTDAPSWCGRSVTGGHIMFVQYPSGAYDANAPCG